jgi:hypothetical protein
MTMYSPLLYIPIAFKISMSSVSSITGLENFCDPQSYSISKGVTYPKELTMATVCSIYVNEGNVGSHLIIYYFHY